MMSNSTTFLKITYNFNQTMREGIGKKRRVGERRGKGGRTDKSNEQKRF